MPTIHVGTLSSCAGPFVQKFKFSGILHIPCVLHCQTYNQATYSIQYQGKIQNRTFKVTKDTPKGEMVKKYYGQYMLRKLMRAPKASKDGIEALGKFYNLVTPETSLIVLETLNQYIEHKICPPKSCKKLYEAYVKHLDTVEMQQKKAKEDKRNWLKSAWTRRINWWNTKFAKYPIGKGKSACRKPKADTTGTTANQPAPRLPEAQDKNAISESVNEDDAECDTLNDSVRAFPGDKSLKKTEKSGYADFSKAPSAEISIKRWVPEQPYIAELNKVLTSQNFSTSLSVLDALYKKYQLIAYNYRTSPGFFFDCAAWFRIQRDIQVEMDCPEMQKYSRACWDKITIRILSNIAETGLDDPRLLRMVSYQLLDWNKCNLAVRLLGKVTKMRPEEPQSWRDLALAYQALANNLPADKSSKKANALKSAIGYFWYTASHKFEAQEGRFRGTEILCLEEMNNCIAKLNRLKISKNQKDIGYLKIPAWATKLLDMDLRITLAWDADLTDIDLHVIDPYGEEAFFGNPLSRQGGLVSRDFTQGYGPEQFILKRAQKGTYNIKVKYYGSSQAGIAGPVTVRAVVITNFGRPNEKRKTISLRMNKIQGLVEVGKITLPGKPFTYEPKNATTEK